MARPRKQIDPVQVEQLAQLGCSLAEIASVLKCSHDTLQRRFALAIKEGHEHRNCSLRRKQYEVAMSGNATMLIWLGKQFLGQHDKQEVMGENGGPLQNSLSIRFVDGEGN